MSGKTLDVRKIAGVKNMTNIMSAIVGTQNHLLRDILSGRADPANSKEKVVAEEITSEHLDLWEGGGEHHGLPPVLRTGHIVLLHDPADLWLEAHVQHSVGLVQAEILAALKAGLASLEEVNQPSRGGRSGGSKLVDQ